MCARMQPWPRDKDSPIGNDLGYGFRGSGFPGFGFRRKTDFCRRAVFLVFHAGG